MEQEVILEMSTVELLERLEEERKQLTKLILNHAVSPLENPNKIKIFRRMGARIETELKKRSFEENQTEKVQQ